MDPGTRSSPRFVADAMLGRLARWLRILGYDTTYDPALDDARLVHLAFSEKRILLTRDTEIARRRRVDAHLLLQENDSFEQLRCVIRELDLEVSRERLLTRCVACNGALSRVAKESVRGLVPPYVYGTQDAFKRCDGCGRIYWDATHPDPHPPPDRRAI